MGQYMSSPSTEKHSEDGSGGKLIYGASAMQGWRMSMEDSHIANPSMAEERGLFAVFDGHGGAEVALFCQRHLTEELMKLDEYKSNSFEAALTRVFHKMDELIASNEYKDELEALKMEGQLSENRQDDWPPPDPKDAPEPDGMTEDKPDELLAKEETETKGPEVEIVTTTPGPNGESEQHTVRLDLQGGLQGYLKKLQEGSNAGMDNIVLPFPSNSEQQGSGQGRQEDGSAPLGSLMPLPYGVEEPQCRLPDHRVTAGCTAVVSLVIGNEVIVANAGDSKAVLSRAGRAIGLSFEHKPQHDVEKRRIEAAGGFVSAAGRVNNNLNLSRSIGDLKYKGNTSIPPKDQMITSEPDICRHKLQPDDEFMLIACDGVWDVMQNQEAVDFVRERISDSSKKLSTICEEIFTACIAIDPKRTSGLGGDNMTAVLVKFDHSKGSA